MIGAGHIGGNLARLFAGAGHSVTVSFSTHPAALAEFAAEVGATATNPDSAVAGADVVVLSVP